MFIKVTQDIEMPEIPPIVVRPRAVARLERIYDGNYCVRNPLELTPLLTIVRGDILEDWELVANRGRIPLRQNELPNEMVEGTPEIIEHLPNAQAKVIRHGRHAIEAEDLISRSIVGIFGDNIVFEVTEGRQVPAQCFTLFSGPGKF
jgi:hypothetical protein